MSIGPNPVTLGLAAGIDTYSPFTGGHDLKEGRFFSGKPTKNYASKQNAVPKTSYTTYVHTTGTWADNHQHAIKAYNAEGTEITGYVNTGIDGGNYTPHQHAVWAYDPELKKPVVEIRCSDSQWKAKSFSLTHIGSWSSNGWGSGTKYVISWLQWTTNTTKCAHVGLYTKNSGSNGFHDGLSSGSTTSKNTKPHCWQRVYHVYTAGTWDFSTNYQSVYMYGHSVGTNTTGIVLKIADVQVEIDTDSPSIFVPDYDQNVGYTERTETIGIKEIISRSYPSTNSLISFRTGTTDRDGVPVFDGTDDKLMIYNVGVTSYTHFTYMCIFKAEGTWANSYISNIVDIDGGYAGHYGIGKSGTNTLNFLMRNDSSTRNLTYNVPDTTKYYHAVGVWDQSSGLQKFYVNGELVSNSGILNFSGSTDSNDLRIGGQAAFSGANGSWFDGEIPVVKYFKRALTATEIKTDFLAYKKRFNL